MVRTGEVVTRQGDTLVVVFERPETCGNCGACLTRQCASVEVPGKADPGDMVEVSMPDKDIGSVSAITYLIPLGFLLAGLLLGAALHGPLGIGMDANLFAALAGGVCLIVGLCIVYGIDRTLRKRADWQPHIVAVHPKQAKLDT